MRIGLSKVVAEPYVYYVISRVYRSGINVALARMYRTET